jgi:hypothetical protein
MKIGEIKALGKIIKREVLVRPETLRTLIL